MQGDAQVITWLQAQLKNELTAINQYFLHYRMYKHWGFDKLAKKEYEKIVGEKVKKGYQKVGGAKEKEEAAPAEK